MGLDKHNCRLGEEHCQALDKILESTAALIPHTQDCIDCGLPVHDYLTALQEQQATAQKLKAKFFPDRI